MHDPNSQESGAQAPENSADVVDSPASRSEWQERLLPLMIRMVVGLTLFFFIASFAQLAYLHVTIKKAPEVRVEQYFPPEEPGPANPRMQEFKVLAHLDASTLSHRYHQANVLLMSRVWARYLGFVTGMILALVGAVFILGKMREAPSEFSGTGAGASVNLRSSSPGLVLAVLGVILMITTIVTHHEIQTADSPVYLRLAFNKPALPATAEPDFFEDESDDAGDPGELTPPPDFP